MAGTRTFLRFACLSCLLLGIVRLNLPAQSQQAGSTQLYLPVIRTNRSTWAFIYREAETPTDKQGYAIQPTRDRGYILAGGTNPTYAQVIKLDSQGEPAWAYNYGGNEGNEGALAVTQTQDGNYVVVGYTYSFGVGNSDGWVLKLDSGGQPLWQETFGWGLYDLFYDVKATPDGGVMMVGAATPSADQNIDMWAIKLAADGALQWQKTFHKGSWDNGTTLLLTPDGGYLLAGFTQATLVSQRNAWLIQLDADGNAIWDKTYGGSQWDLIQDIAMTTDGNYVIVGETSSFGAGSLDGWALKLTPDGVPIWQKAYGDSEQDAFNGITVLRDGSLIVAGEIGTSGFGQPDAWLMQLSDSGAIVWGEHLGSFGGDYMNDVQLVEENLILTGASASYSPGTLDTWALKVDLFGRIPLCGLMISTDFRVADTQANILSGNVVGQDWAIDPIASAAIPNDVNLQTILLCASDRAGLASCLEQP